MRLASKVKGVIGLGRKVMRWGRKGALNIVDWVKGIIVLAILGVGVAIPVVVQTVSSINVSDTMTTLILGFLPAILAVSILLGFLGR